MSQPGGLTRRDARLKSTIWLNRKVDVDGSNKKDRDRGSSRMSAGPRSVHIGAPRASHAGSSTTGEARTPDHLPERFASVEELDEFMSRPSAALIADLAAVPGDITVVGVGGKMGPTVARMAKRACPDRLVIGVARFSEPHLEAYLRRHGVETHKADLLDRAAVAALPQVENVVFMAGRKFGSTGSEDATWAMNAYVPGMVAEHFANSRIIAYSTICVYPFAPVSHGGATEDDAIGPPGEYAMSCVGRERAFQFFSRRNGSPGMLIRLSYAIDMRYGVLHDLGARVLRGETIDLTMGHVNVIWQGDACSQSLRALRHCTVPSAPLNVSGPEIVSIRSLATAFGRRFGKAPVFAGRENDTAWIANTSRAARLFGYPEVPLERMVEWTGDWLERGMASLGKATHFDVRTGTY
jgi:NAD dependent epimerase/dehydratase family